MRTVNPSNCPMCRKAFNPERIKKLHVDKAPADGSALIGKIAEETEFFHRLGMLFAEGAEDDDVNALVVEVTEWLARQEGSLVSGPISKLLLGYLDICGPSH